MQEDFMSGSCTQASVVVIQYVSPTNGNTHTRVPTTRKVRLVEEMNQQLFVTIWELTVIYREELRIPQER